MERGARKLTGLAKQHYAFFTTNVCFALSEKDLVALLVLHPRFPHVDPPTDTGLMMPVLHRNFGTIIDVVFTASLGIYDCDYNKQARIKMDKFLVPEDACHKDV